MANNFLEKVLNLLESVGMRMPRNLEKVQEKFEQIFTDMLQIDGNLSYIQKVRRLQTISKEQESLRKLFEECWTKFTSDYYTKLSFLQTEELQDIQSFLSDVVKNPSQYETKYVNELFELYEKLFNANQGFINIVNPEIFRRLIINLAISKSQLKFKQKYVDKVDQLNWMFVKLNQHFIKKYSQKLQVSKILLTENQIWSSIIYEFFEPMHQQYSGSLVFARYALKLIQNVLLDATITFNWKIDIFKDFIELWDAQESLLHEAFSNERYVSNIKFTQQQLMRSYQEKQDLKRILQNLAREPQRQNSDYRSILNKYVENDMYSEKFESFIVKEYEDIYQRKQQQQKREMPNPFDEKFIQLNQILRNNQLTVQVEDLKQIFKSKDKLNQVRINEKDKIATFFSNDPQKYIEWFYFENRFIFNNKIIGQYERGLSLKDAFSRLI